MMVLTTNSARRRIWKKELGPDFSYRVRDHAHVTCKFRGAALKTCNLRMRRTCNLPVFFHNFRGYDSHFIAMALKDFPVRGMPVTGQGMEKYLTFSLGRYSTFKDSNQFLLSRLATMGKNIEKTGLGVFVKLRKKCPAVTERDLWLQVHKGIYLYEYMDRLEKMIDEQLRPKEAFFSSQTTSNITDADYAHAIEVWKTFNVRTMREYH